MFFIAFAFLLIIVFIGSIVYAKRSNTVGGLQAALPWACILLLLIVSVGTSIKVVPTGNVGIIYEFGSIVNQKSEGLNLILPWQDMKLADIRIQKYTYTNLECFSSETQSLNMSLTVNFKVSPDIIQNLYRNIGPRYFEILIYPKIPQIAKDETVKFKAIDIAPNREALRIAMRDRLKNALQEYSIEVVDVLLENIDFSVEFKQSIELKQIATQKSLEEQEIVKQAKYKAEQVVARARGEAEANLLISNSLTPAILQYTMIQKLSDKIEIMIMPSGQNFILDPSVLLSSE
jgi:regulator of protease activity HflC (stomatin/prohibitin superfamily)